MLLAAAVAADVATAGPPLDLVTALSGYGIVGLFLAALLFRVKVMPTYVYDEFKADALQRIAAQDAEIDALQSELREMNGMFRERVMPVLTRALDAERGRDERHRARDRGDG